MGTRAFAITVALLATVSAQQAMAQEASWMDSLRTNPCRARTATGSPFAICFDPGNRLYVDLSASNLRTGPAVGLGFGLAIRHRVETDDPDVNWRLEHFIGRATLTGDQLAGVLYSGRFLRHAVDGHVLLPTSRPRKLYVPFDIGMEAEVGRIDRGADADDFEMGVIHAAILFEFVRSSGFRRRIAIGPVVRWDMAVAADASTIDRHVVTPFSTGLLDCYLESRRGLTRTHLRVLAGTAWSTTGQWHTQVDAQASLERVVVAINDRPLSLFTRVGYTYDPTATGDGDNVQQWRATLGARLAWSWKDRSR